MDDCGAAGREPLIFIVSRPTMSSIESLAREDYVKSPVWRFTKSRAEDEMHVRPVRRLPVSRLGDCVAGIPVHLANGTELLGVIGHFDPVNPRLNEHFLSLSLFRADGRLFHLARYHDFDAAERGPAQLADFLSLPVEVVFPISYDLSGIVAGSPETLRGQIAAEPRERLTRAEVIALAVP